MQAAWWKKLAAATAAVLVVCVIAGWLVAPGRVASRLAEAVQTHTGQAAVVGHVAVNPFTLTATVTDLKIDEHDAWSVHVPRLVLRYSPMQIVSRAWRLRTVVVDAPIVTFHSGIDALRDGIAGFAPAAPPVVDLVTVTAGEVRIGGDRGYRLTGIAVDIRDIAAGADGTLNFAAVVDGTGQLAASGRLGIAPTAIDARVDMSGIDVGKLRLKPEPGQDAVLASASLDGNFRLELDARQFLLGGDLALADIALVDTRSDATIFTAPKVHVASVTLRDTPPRLSAGALSVSEPHFRIMRVAGNRWSGAAWLRALAHGPSALVVPVSRIDIDGGRVGLVDFAASPSVRFDMLSVNATMTQAGVGEPVRLVVDGRPTATSRGRLAANWFADDFRRSADAKLTLEGLDAAHWSPYFETLAGRSIEAGKLDLSLDIRVDAAVMIMENDIVVRDFEPGAPDETTAEADLALALLTDADGRLRTTVQVPPVTLHRDADPLAVAGVAIVDHLQQVAGHPFEVLGPVAGDAADALRRGAFDAGSAALRDDADETIEALATLLRERPGIAIRVDGRYDPVADRDALAEQQVRLHVALATSEAPPGRKIAEPVDLANPRVQGILDEFAAKRLSAARLASLRSGSAGSPSDYYLSVYTALVAGENVSTTALASLARFRARAIVTAAVAAGADPDRIGAGSPGETRAAGGTIPVSLDIVLAQAGDTP